MTRLKQQFDQTGRLAAAVIISGGILCFFCRTLFPIGHFVDDAMYILLAKTFFGARVPAELVGLVSRTDALPGYPLVLSILLPLVRDSYGLLKLFSILFILLAGWVLFSNLRKEDSGVALLCAAVFIMNPIVVRYSGTVMTEPLFALVSICVISFFAASPIALPLWLYGFLMWLTLIRPEGILVALAVLIGTWGKRSRHERLALGLFVPVPLVVLMAVNKSRTGASSAYVSEFFRQLHGAGNFSALTSNVKALLGLLFPGLLFQVPIPPPGFFHSLVGWGAVLLGGGVCSLGFWLRRRSDFTRVSFVFLVLYFSVHLLWSSLSYRYLMVVLPFVVPHFIFGVLPIPLPPAVRRPALFIFLSLWGAVYAISDVGNLREARARGESEPAATFEAIRGLDPDQAVLSMRAQTVYLKTHHRATRYFLVNDRAAFISTLRAEKTGYVLLEERSEHGTSNPLLYESLEQQVASWIINSGEFVEVYRNEAEGTRIFRLKEM